MWSNIREHVVGDGEPRVSGHIAYRAVLRREDVPEGSNAAFDADLRRRDPSWGVRDLDDVVRLAATHALALNEVVPMPANNLSVVFCRR